MSDIFDDLGSFAGVVTPEADYSFRHKDTPWDFIATFVVDLRFEGDYDIVSWSATPLNGGLDNECYFDECVGNAVLEDLGIDTSSPEYSSGVYRLVFGAKTNGSKYWTDCGYEYDAWEDYVLISRHKFSDDEVEYLVGDSQETLLEGRSVEQRESTATDDVYNQRLNSLDTDYPNW